MIGIKFVLQDMITGKRHDSTELFFPDWNEEVKSLVELNRLKFQNSYPNHRVFAIIVNEEIV